MKVDKECWTHEPEYDKYVKELTRKCFDFVTLLIVMGIYLLRILRLKFTKFKKKIVKNVPKFKTFSESIFA